MRVSKFYLSTLKEAPAEADVTSIKLMLRAGLIRKLGTGLYTWMPLGLLTLRKVETIVREEMNRAGALEVSMPVVQPAELWQETGRWEKMGSNMLRLKDRHDRDFVVGPTHEEVITDIVRREIRSYRQLPVNFYQIQTKFRDEIRPRFGVMRAREFIMKDAYSFDADEAGMLRSYQGMYDAYVRIFSRMSLKFRAVDADTGAIGGNVSHEFQVLADSGEDAIAYSDGSDYAANVEKAEAIAPAAARAPAGEAMARVPTPGMATCEEVAQLLRLPLARTVKCLMAWADGRVHMLLVRGDHMGNEVKIGKLPGMDGWRWASDAEIVEATGCKPGYLGPVGIPREMPLIADRSVAAMGDFVCGANEADFHLRGVNFGRDCREPDLVADIRNVVAGDPSPGRPRHARDRARHRGRSRVRAGQPLFDGPGRNLSRGRRSIEGPRDGVLRHRRHAGRRGGDRAESRRPRASSGRNRSPRSSLRSRPSATTGTMRCGNSPTGCTTTWRPRASTCCSTTAASGLA